MVTKMPVESCEYWRRKWKREETKKPTFIHAEHHTLIRWIHRTSLEVVWSILSNVASWSDGWFETYRQRKISRMSFVVRFWDITEQIEREEKRGKNAEQQHTHREILFIPLKPGVSLLNFLKY